MRKALLAGTLLLSLSACSVLEKPEPETALDQIAKEALWRQHQKSLEALHYWEASGRIAVKSARDGGSAALTWSQIRRAYNIRLAAPLGQGTVRLKVDDTGALMQDLEGNIWRGQDPEMLLFDKFSWRVPLRGLSLWMVGRLRGDEAYKIDRQGRLKSFELDGWHAEYVSYTQMGELSLPKKIHLDNGEFSIRIALNDWSKSPLQREKKKKRFKIPGIDD